MACVKSRDTGPEKFVRSLLHAMGYRFRLYRRDLPGTPDIVFPKYKTAVFVNGCFWHGHKECKYSHLPSTNLEYWEKKIADNLERDERKKRELEELGYRVLTVWQCQLKPRVREENLERLTNEIISG